MNIWSSLSQGDGSLSSLFFNGVDLSCPFGFGSLSHMVVIHHFSQSQHILPCSGYNRHQEPCLYTHCGGGYRSKLPLGVRAPQECREGFLRACGSDEWMGLGAPSFHPQLHTHAQKYAHKASGCRLFGPPLQQKVPALQVCVYLLRQSQSLLVCPTTPDRAVLTSCVSFWFKGSTSAMPAHFWDAVND